MRYPSPVILKFNIGNYRVPVKVWNEQNRIFFDFAFNRELMAEIKVMAGHKWHGYDKEPRKLWSVADCSRNHFAIDFLEGKPVYGPYETQLDTSWVPLYRFHAGKGQELKLLNHQPMLAAHMYQRGGIIAAEMGTSKTLPCIIAMEKLWIEHATKSNLIYSKDPLVGNEYDAEIWYVSPRAALDATRREFRVWGCKLPVQFFTYEAVVKAMKSWTVGRKAPIIVVFDESSKAKNFMTNRSQACFALAEGVREDWGDSGRVILMSGSPAPKSPLDWWSQAEIARPGFLREGDIHKFKNRLAIVIKKEGIAGGAYPEVLAWKDRDDRCGMCGLIREGHDNQLVIKGEPYHAFVPCVNEVAKLYKRLSGLTTVLFKKDCLDLPEKNYRVIKCKVTGSLDRAAKMLIKSSPTVIEGLTRVRELSDGFQYEDVETENTITCPACKGSGVVKQYHREIINQAEPGSGEFNPEAPVEESLEQCSNCTGSGVVKTKKRKINSVPCPKDDILIDLLDEYEDVGRVVIYGGFEGSIERCVAICRKEGWHVIQMNAGATHVWDPNGAKLPIKDYLAMFQDRELNTATGEAALGYAYNRVAFVAHPGSAGMGLTLTASPVIIYYSNDFNAESRIQSEDRIHRTGMDINRGATIIDIIHLDTDLKVLANLKRKRDLQAITLGDIESTSIAGFDLETR